MFAAFGPRRPSKTIAVDGLCYSLATSYRSTDGCLYSDTVSPIFLLRMPLEHYRHKAQQAIAASQAKTLRKNDYQAARRTTAVGTSKPN